MGNRTLAGDKLFANAVFFHKIKRITSSIEKGNYGEQQT